MTKIIVEMLAVLAIYWTIITFYQYRMQKLYRKYIDWVNKRYDGILEVRITRMSPFWNLRITDTISFEIWVDNKLQSSGTNEFPHLRGLLLGFNLAGNLLVQESKLKKDKTT